MHTITPIQRILMMYSIICTTYLHLNPKSRFLQMKCASDKRYMCVKQSAASQATDSQETTLFCPWIFDTSEECKVRPRGKVEKEIRGRFPQAQMRQSFRAMEVEPAKVVFARYRA